MKHITKLHGTPDAPQTEGRTINGLAPFYDALVNVISLGRERKLRQTTADLAQLQPGEQVLEVGCGTGSLTIVVKERVGQQGKAAGIDPSPQMVERARQKATRAKLDVDFRLAAIEDLPYPDNTFNAVLSSLMMHHLPVNVQRSGLAEVYRILKPGGRLAIVDLDSTKVSLANLIHKHNSNGDHPAHQIQNLMNEVGFTEIKATRMKISSLFFLIGYKK